MKKGFTLIELLVVVLIIGILAAVALPQYHKVVEKSKMTQALVLADTLKKNMDIFMLEHGFFPDMEGLDSSRVSSVAGLQGGVSSIYGLQNLFNDGFPNLNGNLQGGPYCDWAPNCGRMKDFIYVAMCGHSGSEPYCRVVVARFPGAEDNSVFFGDSDKTQYVLTLTYTADAGWTKTYTKKANAVVDLSDSFRAMGYDVN